MRKSKQYRFEPETRLEGFTEDTTTAMQASPNYFAWWYSTKSILLVAAVAALAYQLGKNSR